MYVIPGWTAVAVASLVAKLKVPPILGLYVVLGRGTMFTTLGLFAVHVKGPTEAVISVP